MRSQTHAAVAFAVASTWPVSVREAALGRPWILLGAVVLSLLPNGLERIRRAWLCPEFRVVPDPLAPDARLYARGIAAAAWRARATGRSCAVALSPLPGSRPWIRLDTAPASVSAGGCGAQHAEERLPPLRAGWPNRQEIPEADRLIMAFHPNPRDPKTPLHWTFEGRGWPHGLWFAIVVCLLCGWLGGLNGVWSAVAALGSHAFVDHAGIEPVSWLAPVRRSRHPTGWLRWNEQGTVANTVMTMAALAIGIWNLLRHTPYVLTA